VVSIFRMRLNTSYRDMVRRERSFKRQGNPHTEWGGGLSAARIQKYFLKFICSSDPREKLFFQSLE
jgi:hypothetical protein